ncbi:hypothetical protein GCM10011391_38380 [Pullulanibacillus camelliae]|uniref:YbbR-like domain-containing protein n=1 Tax=Pullulanibacillus camelliae TaxID=1707096 RepID=A0A8J2YN97_9BACL|nr:CdaR family protein [Pullulanibacillus camelliae]GGE55703.1 hypothetical protein GCM10011391_38380 [Pullulanibacillus camelliae]
MDKLFRNTWFIKIISFLIALMLFSMVSTKDQNQNNSGGTQIPTGNHVDTVTENLDAQYDSNQYIVLGLPPTVKVRLTGSSETITLAKLQNSRKAYVDLTNKKPGKHVVKVQTKGFPSDLSVEPIPSTINVTIQKKITKTFSVSMDLLNRADIADGYSVGDYSTDPEKVSVTGAEQLVDQIAFVKGVVDLKDVSKSVEQDVPLNAYDKNGNQLDVDIKPSVARVKIPIVSPSKDVPISVKPQGDPADGYAIESMDIDPNTVKVFGTKDVLDGIDGIEDIDVPVDGVNETKTVQVDVPTPKSADQVSPEQITVTVHVGKAVSKVVKDIPILVNDKADKDRQVTFSDPKSQRVDVKLSGAKKLMDQLQRTDVQATIDISHLSKGEHEVPIKVTVPDYMTGTPSKAKATVTIDDTDKG